MDQAVTSVTGVGSGRENITNKARPLRKHINHSVKNIKLTYNLKLQKAVKIIKL